MTNYTADIEVNLRTKQLSLQALFTGIITLTSMLIVWLMLISDKMLTTYLGSSWQTWLTEIVFLQSVAVLAVIYVYLTQKKLTHYKHVIFYLSLFIVALFTLPIDYSDTRLDSVATTPFALWMVLITHIGLPLFVLLALIPLLQQWFSNTFHPRANDPYFFFSYCFLGVLIALFAFFILIEPTMSLTNQSHIWLVFYIANSMAVFICIIALWQIRSYRIHYQKLASVRKKNNSLNSGHIVTRASNVQRCYWLLLVFIPTCLLFSFLNYINSRVINIPLSGIILLTFYAASIVIAFSRQTWFTHRTNTLIQLCLLLPFFIINVTHVYYPNKLFVLLVNHLMFFFSVLVCFGELNKRRPQAKQVVEFYFWVTLGALLASLFSTLMVPFVLSNAIELPLLLISICLLVPVAVNSSKRISWPDWLTIIGAIGLLTMAFLQLSNNDFATLFGKKVHHTIVNNERNFIVSQQVIHGDNNQIHLLYDGVTLQGGQFYNDKMILPPLHSAKHVSLCSDDKLMAMESINRIINNKNMSLYQPLYEILSAGQANSLSLRVAIVGINAGATACLARANDQFTFYETDPALYKLAMDRHNFTYLTDCRPIAIKIGNPRRELMDIPSDYYHAIIFDNLSRSLLATNLITREAIELYLTKIDSKGLLLFNISNQHLDLKNVLAAIADNLHLVARTRTERTYDPIHGQSTSVWVVLAQSRDALGDIENNPAWQPLPPSKEKYLWTDNYSSLLRIIKFN